MKKKFLDIVVEMGEITKIDRRVIELITANSIENVNQFCGFTASFRIDVIIAKRGIESRTDIQIDSWNGIANTLANISTVSKSITFRFPR